MLWPTEQVSILIQDTGGYSSYFPFKLLAIILTCRFNRPESINKLPAIVSPERSENPDLF